MTEKLFFPNSHGLLICGVLSVPDIYSDSESKSVVILCHGLGTGKSNRTNTRLQENFNNLGIATFKFDFFGHGESEGEFENLTVSEAVEEIFLAIDLMRSRGFEKIALVGTSFGGRASILACSATDDICVLALKSAVSDYKETESVRRSPEELEKWKQDGFLIHSSGSGKERRLKYSFYEDSISRDVYNAGANISIPTIIVHGTEDEVVPATQSEKLAKIIKDSRLELIAGADHRYSEPADFDRMIQLITDFVATNLENAK